MAGGGGPALKRGGAPRLNVCAENTVPHAFLKNITQVLHANLSMLAQHLPALPRARGRSWQKFVASHPDYAAGGSRLLERTVNARACVHGVRTHTVVERFLTSYKMFLAKSDLQRRSLFARNIL